MKISFHEKKKLRISNFVAKGRWHIILLMSHALLFSLLWKQTAFESS